MKSPVRIDSKGNDIQRYPCPHCRAMLNAATSLIEDVRPSPGDVSVCFACGGMLRFDDLMLPAILTEGELQKLHADDRAALIDAQEFVRNRNPQ